ncbi:MAG: hypothetical protein COW48_07155 [Hydrogenophilales bacterium CG17_big_fil_post_rev_8_21_14_2_50_63_12]|nr:MAG: hypothetical protein COW48_07155 [Hydrogenophilales bacterium CG17_big_fil_post_rev_8_21_14_2_50_63_12]PJB03214.1 MAG: hypothetical protein CO126_07945 [Hydrogenophilales bacterium CG_4_9_14_3_um_filter_63_34]
MRAGLVGGRAATEASLICKVGAELKRARSGCAACATACAIPTDNTSSIPIWPDFMIVSRLAASHPMRKTV